MKYMITKVDNPRSEKNGWWLLASYEIGTYSIMEMVDKIAWSEKRKPLIDLAKEKNIDVFSVDSGRKLSGCKW